MNVQSYPAKVLLFDDDANDSIVFRGLLSYQVAFKQVLRAGINPVPTAL